jgi:hypothetical protein
MKCLFTILCGMLALTSVEAQVFILNTTGPTAYSQNFDGLGQASILGAFSSTIGTPTHISGLSGITGLEGWHGAKCAGTSTANSELIADEGSSNTGSIYSYGANTSSDRALGVLASGPNTMVIGFLFQNNTGSTLDTLTLSFTAEFWRSSTTTQNVLQFGYGKVDGTTVTTSNFLTASSSSTLASLNITGPAAAGSSAALDGNAVGNRTAFTDVALGGLNLAQGETLYLRWADTNDGGSDAGLALDDLSFGVTPLPEPAHLALVAIPLLWWMHRRRNKAPTS